MSASCMSFQSRNETNLKEESYVNGCIWWTEEQIDEILGDQKSSSAGRAREADTGVHHRLKRKIVNFGEYPRNKWAMPITWKFDGKHRE